MNAKEELTRLLMESYDRGVADASKSAIKGIEYAYNAGAAAERQRWAEVKSYLVAARDGSMSRNNSETLAGELLEQLERDINPASTSPQTPATSPGARA